MNVIAELPPMGSQWLMYAHRSERAGDFRWRNFATSVRGVLLHGRGTVVPVRVQLVPDGTPGAYFGWYDSKDGSLRYIWGGANARDICFAGGPAKAEARGEGRRVHLAITEMDGDHDKQPGSRTAVQRDHTPAKEHR